MNPDPYSQTAQDPTQQQGLLQILQQIQAIQNRPLIPDNPLSQLGAALQGASAGYAGQPNPAIAQAMAQRQQQLSGLSQTAGVLGQIGSMQQHQAALAETKRARAIQESTAAGKDQLERIKFRAQLAMDRIKDPNLSVRAGGYRDLQALPIEYGGIDPKANPDELAANTKEKFDELHDEAIALLLAGEDPQGPAWAKRFSGVPLTEYKATIARDPLAAWGLFKKRPTADDFLKMLRTSFAAVPEAERSVIQQRILATLGEEQKVNYGEQFYRVGAELAGTPSFGPWNSKAPTPQQAAKINQVIEENKRPSIERLTGEIFSTKDPDKRRALIAQRDELVEQYAKIQGAKTSATVAATPPQEADRKDIQAFSASLAMVEQLQTFTPKEISEYTGLLRNPAARAKRFAQDVTGMGTPDERFSQFEALMGQFQKGLFAEGGKQLTEMERRVAIMGIPTGREAGGATEMLAKAKYLAAFVSAGRAARLVLAKTGKADLDPDVIDGMIRAQMAKRGYAAPTAGDPTPWTPPVKSVPPPKGNWRPENSR